MSHKRFEVDPVTPSIGAEIRGLELGEPLTESVADRLYEVLLEHLVVFFRDQDLGPNEQLAFAASFGEVDEPHPVYPHVEGFAQVVLLESGPDKKPDTNEWHTDLTFYEHPPFASILWAREVPTSGGDTMWANMYDAYDALPGEVKQLIGDKQAIHDCGDFRNDFLAEGGVSGLNASLARTGSAVHPVAPRHPVTGRRYLYINPPFTRMIVGMSWNDSQRLLDYLFDHIDSPEFQVRFRWRPRSLAMWDNRVTQHYAVNDYWPARRSMHRVTVVRDRRASPACGN